MILDLRFEQLKPRCVPQFIDAFQAALPARSAVSPLSGLWRSEVGAVDQVLHVWTYADMSARADALARAGRLVAWTELERSPLLLEQECLLVEPAAFSPPQVSAGLGRFVELRVYTYEPGRLPTVAQRWQERIEARLRYSPLVFCGAAVAGRLNRWVHMWAYDSLAERQAIRAQVVKDGVWPPDAREGLVIQHNMLFVAVPTLGSV